MVDNEGFIEGCLLEWWTTKDLSRDGHLAWMMVAMKDALINLAFHLAVM